MRLFLGVLLVIYCAKQVATALLIPPFTGHDELAHYQYVRVLADDHRIPTLTTAHLPAELYRYKAYVLDWDRWGPHRAPLYTAMHPPLYYAVMVPFYNMARSRTPEEQQYILRMCSISFGALTVLLAYWLVRIVLPADTFVALGTTALVAFQPQVSYEASLVNNDAMATALYTLVLCAVVLGIRNGFRTGTTLAVGVCLGAAALSKGTALTAVPLVLVAIWLAPSAGSSPQRAWKTLVALGTTALFIAPWYAFMWRTYGDFSGLRQLAVLQPNRVHDAPLLQLFFSGDFAVDRWEETWGLFGWRLIPASGWVLAVLTSFAFAALLGLIAFAFVVRIAEQPGDDRETLAWWQAVALLVLFAACVVSYLAVLQFGTRFTLAQARYFFPAVVAWAFLTMIGLRSWLPGRGYRIAQGALVLALVALNVLIYTAHVVPHWYFH